MTDDRFTKSPSPGIGRGVAVRVRSSVERVPALLACSGIQDPLGKSGPMSEEERFLFEVFGYLVIPAALNQGEVEECLEAAKRLHAPYPANEWRQLGAAYEKEPAFEPLIDHPSILPKARALL